MVDFKKMLYQTNAIRKDSDKPQTSITLTADAKKIFRGIRKELKTRCPGIEITKSLVVETFIRMCKNILIDHEMEAGGK